MTALEGYLPAAPGGGLSPRWYPPVYVAKVAAVCALVWACRSTLRDLLPRPTLASVALAVVVGLGVAVAWVGLDGLYPEIPGLGRRAAFDPGRLQPPARFAFLAVRLCGLVVLVPLIEELFYRSFLMRWVVDPVYTRVPIGKVTPVGLGVTSLVFAGSHPEWLPALLTGLAWAWLLARTKCVSACVLSHAAANLALGLYVLRTGAWRFW
jgi:CAAX prenyl protease-like protein